MPTLLTPPRLAAALGAALCLAFASARAATVEVSIENYHYVPATVTIRAGDTVRWTNAEKRTSHTILLLGQGGESNRLFPGETHEHRFERPGRYDYTCGPHPEMRGVVVVE